jgi:DNA-binding NtrC family response regulator
VEVNAVSESITKKEHLRFRRLIGMLWQGRNAFYPQEQQLYGSVLSVVEKPLIELVLEETRGNQLKAARILGLNRNTLHTKIRRLAIDTKQYRSGRGK